MGLLQTRGKYTANGRYGTLWLILEASGSARGLGTLKEIFWESIDYLLLNDNSFILLVINMKLLALEARARYFFS